MASTITDRFALTTTNEKAQGVILNGSTNKAYNNKTSKY